MPILALDHVQLAMPPGREAEARAFYAGVLGFAEREKPPNLAARGGCWFAAGTVNVHLGIERNFAPARKAHPAFRVDDLADLVARLERAGHLCTEDEPLAGYNRRYVEDPFGNRIELMKLIATKAGPAIEDSLPEQSALYARAHDTRSVATVRRCTVEARRARCQEVPRERGRRADQREAVAKSR